MCLHYFAVASSSTALREHRLAEVIGELSCSPDDILTLLKKSKSFRVRARTGRHRLIGIRFVVVKDRVFARSRSVKPDGWYYTFLSEPRGAIQVGKTEIEIRALPIKTKLLRDAVDRAYREKYNTTWELKYAKDLASEKSRATTVELLESQGIRQNA